MGYDSVSQTILVNVRYFLYVLSLLEAVFKRIARRQFARRLLASGWSKGAYQGLRSSNYLEQCPYGIHGI